MSNWMRWFYASMGFFVGMSVAVGLISMSPSRPANSPVTWFPLEKDSFVVCPGEIINMPLTIGITRKVGLDIGVTYLRSYPTSAAIMAVESNPNLQKFMESYGLPLDGDTVQGQRRESVLRTAIPSKRIIVDPDAQWVVPDFPPGQYSRVVWAAVVGENVRPQMMEIKFTVRDHATCTVLNGEPQ